MVELPTLKPSIFQRIQNKLSGHLICLFTLIINIYGLGVGISTIIKFTSGRGWGMTPRGLSYKAFNLPSHPDHKYIYDQGE
jgi:hypothetical protein